jgi:iron complex outermembrane recepter protein
VRKPPIDRIVSSIVFPCLLPLLAHAAVEPVKSNVKSDVTLASTSSSPVLLAQSESGPAPTTTGDSEPTKPEDIQEVVVTGSHIARSDYTSDSPLTTVQQDILQNTASVSLESKLLELPQFAGAATSQFSAGYFNSGAATLNLRNLGDNRNLVLLDGRRLQPSTTDLAIDINTIPQVLIDSVEIITGGASAAYGADAVSGVVNFKLKRHFEGAEIQAYYGASQRGDAQTRDINALLGSNFGSGRGNVTLALEYSDRGAVDNSDLAWERPAFQQGNGGASYLASGYFSPVAGNLPSQTALNSYFGQFGAPAGSVTPATQLGFNNDGSSLFNITGKQIYNYNNPLYPRYAVYTTPGTTNKTLVQNFSADTLASLPLKRWSAFGSASYDITDGVQAFTQLMYTHYDSTTEGGAPVAAGGGWHVDVPYDAAHPVPASFASLLNSRPTPGAIWTLNKDLSFMGEGVVQHSNNVFQLLAGLHGKVPSTDITWDLSASHGETDLIDSGDSGFASLARYTQLIQAPNYGANFKGAYGTCTSGINPFGEQNGVGAGQYGNAALPMVSADCIAYLNPDWTNRTKLTQDIIELTTQGKMIDLPAGEARFALGVDYRSDGVSYQPDKGFTPNAANYDADIIGQFGTSAVSGNNNVKEAYAEALIPVLKDLPFIKRLELDAAYRYGDYNHAGGTNTYKLDVNWQMFDPIRLRGGYQRAVRAPNVVEQFGPPTLVFDSATDACQSTAAASYANIPSNPNRAQVQKLCRTLMGAGAPPITDPVNDPNGLNTYLGSASASLNSYPSGNPNLKPEVADTYTAGLVFSPTWDLPADMKFNASVDYYNIDIKGAIGYVNAQLTYQLCFNADGHSNPNYDPNNIYCKTIARQTSQAGQGLPSGVFSTYLNQGSIKTSGIDIQGDWRMRAGPGMVGLNIIVNYLDSFDRQVGPGAPSLSYVGFAGGYYRWKSYTNLTYQVGPAMAGLRWHHLPSVKPQDYLVSSCTTSFCYANTPSYEEFDLYGSYQASNNVEIHAGIDNLMNRWPPVTRGFAGTTDAQNYDIIGRRFYLSVTAKF